METETTLTQNIVNLFKKNKLRARLKTAFATLANEITQNRSMLNSVLPISIVGESFGGVLEVNNPYPSNTLTKIVVYKQLVGAYEEVPIFDTTDGSTIRKVIKNEALDNYKIEGLDDGKYHIVFLSSATFTPYI